MTAPIDLTRGDLEFFRSMLPPRPRSRPGKPSISKVFLSPDGHIAATDGDRMAVRFPGPPDWEAVAEVTWGLEISPAALGYLIGAHTFGSGQAEAAAEVDFEDLVVRSDSAPAIPIKKRKRSPWLSGPIREFVDQAQFTTVCRDIVVSSSLAAQILIAIDDLCRCNGSTNLHPVAWRNPASEKDPVSMAFHCGRAHWLVLLMPVSRRPDCHRFSLRLPGNSL